MSRTPAIIARSVPAETVAGLVRHGVHPLLARVYAARGITVPQQIAAISSISPPPESMLNLGAMARLLADAIAARKRLLIVADYDADGATACAVGVRALTAFGADRRVPGARTASSTDTGSRPRSCGSLTPGRARTS